MWHFHWKMRVVCIYSKFFFISWFTFCISLVENMVKKNCNRFPIVVLLTTLIYSHQTNAYLFYWFTNWIFKKLGAFNMSLERSWNTFPMVYYMPPKSQNCSCKTQKIICNRLVNVDQGVKRTAMGKQLRFFLPCFLLVICNGNTYYIKKT
jgi:hypothetical protein